MHTQLASIYVDTCGCCIGSQQQPNCTSKGRNDLEQQHGQTLHVCTCALIVQGGPHIGVCLGRIDDDDGTASLPLGPTAEQQLSKSHHALRLFALKQLILHLSSMGLVRV